MTVVSVMTMIVQDVEALLLEIDVNIPYPNL